MAQAGDEVGSGAEPDEGTDGLTGEAAGEHLAWFEAAVVAVSQAAGQASQHQERVDRLPVARPGPGDRIDHTTRRRHRRPGDVDVVSDSTDSTGIGLELETVARRVVVGEAIVARQELEPHGLLRRRRR